MVIQLQPISPQDLKAYKAMAQEAFQLGYEDYFGKSQEAVLPEEDIDRSLNAKGCVAYKAVTDGEIVGGAIVVIHPESRRGSLDFLFVKRGVQSRGIGKAIWFALEKLHPETGVWTTCTPYFDKRNIHFYVNVCGFHIVEFFHARHPDPNGPQDFGGEGSDGMFAFEKRMEPEEEYHGSF